MLINETERAKYQERNGVKLIKNSYRDQATLNKSLIIASKRRKRKKYQKSGTTERE